MKTIILTFLTSVSLLTLSCKRDNAYSEYCNTQLKVRALDGDDSKIKDVTVYVYNLDNILIGYHSTQVNTPFDIKNYINYGAIKLVSWGNAMGNNASQILSTPTIGSSMFDHSLQLTQRDDNFDGKKLTKSPSDLYYGVQNIYFDNIVEPITTVYIDRVAASFILTLKNIGNAFEDPNNDYKVMVRHPNSGFNFSGKPIGDPSIYLVDMVYDPIKDQLTSDINMALPTGDEGLIIDIYAGGKLVRTVKVDKSGNEILLYSNKLQNILIDLSGDQDVNIVVTEWDDVMIFQGFD